MAEFDAGRDLDVKVAERVMDFTLDWNHTAMQEFTERPEDRAANRGRGVYMRCPGCDRHGYGNEVDWAARCPTPDCRPYSTDIAAAWEVVEHLQEKRFYFSLYDDHEITNAGLGGARRWTVAIANDYTTERARDRSLPLAICRAALAALEVQP